MTHRASQFSGGGEEEKGAACVFALPNLIFLRTKGRIWRMVLESKERCNPFLITFLPVNTPEQ